MENYKYAKINDCGGDLAKRWYVSYYYKHPETGKFQRFVIWIPSTLKTKTARLKKASVIVENINIRLKQGFDPFECSTSRVKSLSEAIELALELKTNTCRERGARTYKNISTSFLAYLKRESLLEKPADSFSFQRAQEYMDYLIVKKKVSNRTYNNHLLALKTLFNTLYDREIVTHNPFQRVKKLRLEDSAITAFTRDDLELVRSTLPEFYKPLWIIAQLVYFCFMRPTEIRRLRVKDFDLERQFITVHGHQSKNKKQELVVIPNPLVKELKDFGIENLHPDLYLFSTRLLPGKSLINPDRISEWWNRYKKKVNLDKNIYDLKSTGVGMLFDSGANARDIQLQIRHHSLDQTIVYLNKFRRIPSDSIKTNFPAF